MSLLSEEKEKEKQKLNLILHQIPEITLEGTMERKAHDTDHTQSIFHDYLKVDVPETQLLI